MDTGIDRRRIFENDDDQYHLLSRLGDILSETKTVCYAWALIPNHFHLILRISEPSGGYPSAQPFILGSQKVGCDNDIAIPPTGFIGNSRRQIFNTRRKSHYSE
jgi:hypothetical protein